MASIIKGKLEIPHFEEARVLVYGDLMLDRYWYGNASRISPEAPVPVVQVKDTQSRPGGAANVALNIAELGSEVSLFGLVGEDQAAADLEAQLIESHIQSYLHRIKDCPTVTKLRVLGQNQQLIRMDFERGFNGVDDASLIEQYKARLADVHVVVLSDYAKGALQHVKQLIALANDQGVPVLIDPKSSDFSVYSGAMLITPNLKEFEGVLGRCADVEEMIVKARKLLHECQIQSILITRGKEGMLLVQQNAEPVNLSTKAREVYDVTGAGDTVISIMAAAVSCQLDLVQAAQLANLGAGIVVGKLGAATVSIPELRRALQRQSGSHLGILTEEELVLAVSDARAHDEDIVMTNGCFDILHAGHVQYLEQAKSLGKRLIVAVNDDDSIRRLKGSDRPVNSVENRMAVLSSLRAVDWVVPFSEDTPARLIGKILPNMLVKGGDYTPDEIAGSDAVITNGGEVRVLDLKEGCSTSFIIKKIKDII